MTLPEDQLRAIRGNDIAMIFQDPLSSLHPLYKVGKQLDRGGARHRDVVQGAGPERAIELLGLVGIPDPAGAWTSTRTSSPAACASAR